MTTPTFEPFPKIARLFRDVVITEKIDGTNAAVGVTDDLAVYAQSRKRLITPDDDNFGFAKWVRHNEHAVAATLGPGLHFGEWWGSGIQRGYGLTGGEKRFSLFNTARWADVDLTRVPALGVVPVLYEGPFTPDVVADYVHDLGKFGSRAAPGFDRPEGVVVYHTASRQLFKVTVDNDEAPKGLSA